MAKTFKQLQDDTLAWMADQNDTGLMRTLVKQAIDQSQRELLSDQQLDFMLSPVTTLSVITGQQVYYLPTDVLSLLYVFDAARNEYLEEVPVKSTIEAEDGIGDAGIGIFRYRVTTVDGVRAQPATAGQVVITPSGGNEASANSIVIHGLTTGGELVSEAVSSGSSWASLTSASSFARVDSITKVGTTWTRSITVTVGATTLLVLPAADYTRQYQKLELMEVPTTSQSLQYRYYKRPHQLVYDNQLPEVPEAYSDMLIYKALLALPGFTRATPEELTGWLKKCEQWELSLKQNYQQARTLGARARRVKMVPRI